MRTILCGVAADLAVISAQPANVSSTEHHGTSPAAIRTHNPMAGPAR